MSTLRTAMGLPVVAEDSAEQAGSVSGFQIDPDAASISAIYLGGKRSSAKFVSWRDIRSFGSDAVIIATSESVHTSADDAEQRVASGELDVLDKLVLTEIGDEFGVVDDVEFDPDDGHLQQLSIASRSVDSECLLGIGTYAVVITAQDEERA